MANRDIKVKQLLKVVNGKLPVEISNSLTSLMTAQNEQNGNRNRTVMQGEINNCGKRI